MYCLNNIVLLTERLSKFKEDSFVDYLLTRELNDITAVRLWRCLGC